MKKSRVFYLTIVVLMILVNITACTPVTEQSINETSTNDSSENEPAVNSNDSGSALLSVTDTPQVETKEIVTLESTNADNAAASKDDATTAVLIYQRSGGLKGIGPSDHEWQFYEDGRIVGNDGASWQVEPAVIKNLVAEIMASGFQNLENSYIPEDTCCDRATYVITVQTGGQTYTVETLDGADMPQSLQDNLQKINDFLMSLYG